MAYKIHLERRALAEVDAALEHYSKINIKVLKNFNTDLQKAYKTIAKNPFFEKRHKELRGFPLKKYPFLIVFTINEKEKSVIVFAVFNTNQNPNKLP
jgi:hypothetical protein